MLTSALSLGILLLILFLVFGGKRSQSTEDRGELTTSIVQFFLGLVKILFWIGIFLFFFWVLFIGDMDKKVDFLSKNIPGLDRFVEPVVEWEYVRTDKLTPKDLAQIEPMPATGQCFTLDPKVKNRLTVRGHYSFYDYKLKRTGEVIHYQKPTLVKPEKGVRVNNAEYIPKDYLDRMHMTYGDSTNTVARHYGVLLMKITSPEDRSYDWSPVLSKKSEFYAKRVCFTFLLGVTQVDKDSINSESILLDWERVKL